MSLIIDLQVLASKTKIYMVLECVTGGDLFDRIVRLMYIATVTVLLVNKKVGFQKYALIILRSPEESFRKQKDEHCFSS